MRKDIWEDLIKRIDKLTEKVEAITASLNKEKEEDLEEFFNNEFILTISKEEVLKRRVNIFRKGNEVGSLSIDEIMLYLNNEMNLIIDNEILKRYK